MRIVDNADEDPDQGAESTTGTAKYPWETWLSNQTIIIEHGTDYTCSPTSIKRRIRDEARERKELRVTYKTHPYRDGMIMFRTYPQASRRPALPDFPEADTEADQTQTHIPTCQICNAPLSVRSTFGSTRANLEPQCFQLTTDPETYEDVWTPKHTPVQPTTSAGDLT